VIDGAPATGAVTASRLTGETTIARDVLSGDEIDGVVTTTGYIQATGTGSQSGSTVDGFFAASIATAVWRPPGTDRKTALIS
jgi:hypothetical protein